MYSLSGASLGAQVGGTATDYVLLIMSQKGVDAMLSGKIKLGNEATAAAGPGATATSTSGGADILIYAKASGLFAGASLGSATLEPDNNADKRLYGKDVTVKEILVENTVKPTPDGEQFVSLLDSKAGTHKK
jgi:lipid-binding SYLF domain-containing protein